jgi:replicative DNA helicase
MTPQPQFKRNNRGNTDGLIYGKMPPQAPDLEGPILGAIMLEPAKLDTALTIIYSAECFYSDANQRVFAAIRKMHQEGKSIDFMTVTNELRSTNELETVGGSYYVMGLTRDVVSSANLEEHCRIVVQYALKREIIKKAGQILNDAYDDAKDVFDLLDEAYLAFEQMIGSATTHKSITLRDGINEAIQESITNSTKEGGLVGKSTGFDAFDEGMGGIITPDFTVLGGGTGEGKTTTALNLAFNYCESDPMMYISLEMKAKQLAKKKLSHDTGYSYRDIERGKTKGIDGNYVPLPPHVFKQMQEIEAKMSNTNFHIYDKGGLSVATFRNLVAYYKKKFGITFFIIDYFQLINGNGSGRKFSNKTEEMSFISNQCKSICNEYDVSIMALSQFKRITEERLYKKSDLKETGSLEQDADNVLLLFSPLQHNVREVEIDGVVELFNDTQDLLLQIEKCRADSVGIKKMKLNARSNMLYEPHKQSKQPADFSTAPEIKPIF